MTLITTHQLNKIARAARAAEPNSARDRTRVFFRLLAGALSDREAQRLCIAMGINHITHARPLHQPHTCTVPQAFPAELTAGIAHGSAPAAASPPRQDRAPR